MSEEVQKKGMSKGCMVGLIVGLVIVIIVAALMVTCYMKKDELAKFGTVTLLNGAKATLSESPLESVDTVKFNGVVDQFMEKFNNEEELDYEKAAKLFALMQSVPANKKVDSTDVSMILDAIFTYYPDMEQSVTPEMEMDTTAVTDSM